MPTISRAKRRRANRKKRKNQPPPPPTPASEPAPTPVTGPLLRCSVCLDDLCPGACISCKKHNGSALLQVTGCSCVGPQICNGCVYTLVWSNSHRCCLDPHCPTITNNCPVCRQRLDVTELYGVFWEYDDCHSGSAIAAAKKHFEVQ